MRRVCLISVLFRIAIDTKASTGQLHLHRAILVIPFFLILIAGDIARSGRRCRCTRRRSCWRIHRESCCTNILSNLYTLDSIWYSASIEIEMNE